MDVIGTECCYRHKALAISIVFLGCNQNYLLYITTLTVSIFRFTFYYFLFKDCFIGCTGITMDSISHRSSSSPSKFEGFSVNEKSSASEVGQHKIVTSEHGLSHRVTLEQCLELSASVPVKVKIEPNINLVIDSRHRLGIEDDDGNALLPENEWRIRQNYRDEMLSMLHNFNNTLNSQLQEFLNIHLLTSAPDQEISSDCLLEPFGEAEPHEPDYVQKTLMDKLLPWRAKEINHKNDALAKHFLDEKKAWGKKKQHYQKSYLEFWNDRFLTAQNTEFFLGKLLEKAIHPLNLHMTISSDESSSTVWINIHFPKIKTLPGLEYKVLEKELRLVCRSLSPTKKRQYYMKQIHAIGFRLIGEVFSSFSELKNVVLSGYSERLNPATAHVQQDYLYSVKVAREQWQGINFQALPELSLTEVMATFELRRNMTKTGIFKAIEPFSIVQKQPDIFTDQGMTG